MSDSGLKGFIKMSGELTAKIAEKIKDDWEKRGYVVFYDHGKKKENNNVGKIVVWCGDGEKTEWNTELSQLDIAIVEKTANNGYKAIVLIEVEETSDRPKTLLGDIFGMLFGDHVGFGEINFEIGDYTTLVVAGISKSKEGHALRNDHIEEVANQVRSSVGTPNSKIGKVVVKVYKDEDEIQKLLPKDLEGVVRGGV